MLVQHFAYKGSHIGARALLDIQLIYQLLWFGYIARLSQWVEEGYFTCSNDSSSRCLQCVGGVSTLW